MSCPGRTGLFRRVILAMCLLLVVQVGQVLGGSVRLYWDANTEPDLAGYVLVYGPAPGIYTTSVPLSATAVTHELTDLPAGTYYFAIRAFNAANAQSGYSNEVEVVVTATPDEPSSPSITSVTPSSGPTTGGTTITINGTDFRDGATVLVGGAAASVMASTDTWAMFLAPAHGAGSVDVTVTNPDGGTYTLASAFTYVTPTAPVSDPIITSVTPASGPTTGGSAITI